MKKLNLNNLYESHLPPERVDILWADKDEMTGDLKSYSQVQKWQLGTLHGVHRIHGT